MADTQSFSEAARLSNQSQPALSRTIRLLEEDFGVRLFDRNTRNVSLTAAGEALLPIVERLTGDFDSAFAELAHSFAGRRGRVIIGVLPSIAATTLPPQLAKFQRDRPMVEIVLRDALSGSLYQQLRERQLDFAIATPPEVDDGEFTFVPLFTDSCALLCCAGDTLDTKGAASWDLFATHPFIAMAPRSSVRLMTDSAFAKADLVIRPLYECAQLATVGALVAAGLGITALPLSTIPLLERFQLVWRPLRRPVVERAIGLASLSHRTLPPAAQALLQSLTSGLRAQIDKPAA